MMLLGQLALLCLVVSVVPHKHGEWRCGHTASSHNITYRVGIRHHGSESAEGHHIEKRATDQPFRMFVYYDSSVSNELSSSVKTRVQNTINNLKDFFEKVLSVRPTQGPILLERTCSNNIFYFPVSGSDDRRCMTTCASTSTCGDIAIPSDHLKACIQCNGSPSNCQTVGSDGAGVDDYDFILYVSATISGSCPTSPSTVGTIAFAGPCQMESEYDRPIAGYVNFCPTSLTGDDVDDDFVLAVAKHEILHALAFTSALYPWWRDEDGEPRTPRESSGYPPQDLDGDFVVSTSTMKTITYTDWETRTGTVDHSVTMLVTPRILQEARNHFDCPTLEGMELENQGTSFTALQHWEKRLVENEGMTGVVSFEPVFSRLTFALLEDSGWYSVDYSMAGQLLWGHHQGCEFAAGSCGGFINYQLQQNQALTPFCNRLNDKTQLGCTVSRSAVSYCNLVTFSSSLPTEYQYFESGANFDSSNTDVSRVGGDTLLNTADFCPYQKAFADTMCGDSANDKGTGFDNVAGESYGSGARCVEQGDQPWMASNNMQTFTPSNYGAGCYQYSCSDSTVTITVFGSAYTCTEKGQIINVEITESDVTHTGTLICPSCVDICYDDFVNCPEAADLFSEFSSTSGLVHLVSPFMVLIAVLATVLTLMMQ